ncbi:MAG TPA: glycosyltransferase family 39 protein [Chloroflexi bacterium]|nr:glycosyltransferase family 39 protein [Chloroflexota bacterium]
MPPTPTPPASGRRTQPWLLALATGVLFVAAFALLLGINLRRELNHDEHQFVASAALIARTGLTPYVDFPYFHVPLLSYLYALIFTVFEPLLLSSRVASVIAGWLALALIFAIAWRRFAAHPLWTRWGMAALASMWLLATPVFFYTSGRAWNHDLPILLLLLAFGANSRALTSERQARWLAMAGALTALAAVTRLSFAFAGAPLLAAAWLMPTATRRQHVHNVAAFTLAGVITGGLALAPTLRDAPALFFGNVVYIQLNARYYAELAYGEAMSLAAKLAYFGELLGASATNLIVLATLAIGLWPLRTLLWRSNREASAVRFRLWLLLALMLFTLPGAFGATPSQPQYFYPLFPLAILAIVEAFAAWPPTLQGGGLYAYVLGGATALLVAAPIYGAGQITLWSPGDWLPSRAHAYGGLIGRLVGDGRVLTLAPIYALEGGAAIYPQFATGPFAWRVAPLMPVQARARFHMVGPDDLATLLADAPARAILTGVENDDAALEQPLLDYAQTHAYVPVPLPDKSTLWLAPQAQWAETIQLGGHDLPSAPVAPGASFVLTLHLQSLRPMNTNWSVLIRVVDAAGAELLRDEGWPYGAPTSQWPVGDVWPDGHVFTVPPDAAPGYYRVDASFYDPNTLEELGAPATLGYLLVGEAERAPTAPPLARFGDGIDLEAAAVTQSAASETAITLTVATAWRVQQPPAQDYTLFIHVLDAAGHLVAQHDGAPVNGFLPTSAWRSALTVHDTTEIALPPDLPRGEYRVVAGFYDPATLARLPVTQPPTAGDAFTLGIATVAH